jgi:cell wall-associated NlpC family hydrolase
MRRGLALVLLVAATLALAAPARASWADAQIAVVVEHGLMAPSVETFRPNAALTRAELGEILATVSGEPQVVIDPERAVSLSELDAALVKHLGLGPAADHFRTVAVEAGIASPRRLGTEVVARLLRLRYNHPARRDYRELLPSTAITRAETAFSLARLPQLSQWDLDRVNELASGFALPRFTAWQDRVLSRAVRFVGFPYVWGGMWEHTQVTFGVTSRGGFDCSGFVWRVYKQPFSGGGSLQYVLRGRTTYQMAGEVPRSSRVPFDRLKPADVIFFGDRGPRSAPSEVGHMGIYVGGGWFIHSSGQGVTLVPLTGWYRDKFAWARRPLREAGLT